jgi:hypothetical protein
MQHEKNLTWRIREVIFRFQESLIQVALALKWHEIKELVKEDTPFIANVFIIVTY